MHGIIHRTLKQYVSEQLPDVEFETVVEDAGVEPKLYLPVSHYEDWEATAIVTAVAERTGREESAIYRDFGRTLAPELLDTFGAHVRDDWGFVGLLERLGDVYADLSSQNEETEPPTVSCDQVGASMLVLTYGSDRELCYLGEGILDGLAEAYAVEMHVTQTQCTHRGDDHCEFEITLE